MIKVEFSVLMSLYSKERPEYLGLALNGVFDQTLLPSEMIIVADGVLTPSLYGVIEEYSYRLNIKLIQLKENVGLGKALSEGLKHCSYNLIARVDSDDICYRNRFEKQIDFLLANPHISVVGSYLSEFNKVPRDCDRVKKVPLEPVEVIAYSKNRNPLNHPSVMYKKNDILQVGAYKHMPYFEDYYLWLRLIKMNYKIANIPEPLVYFRIGSDMIGRRHGIAYLSYEYKFFKCCWEENIIGFWQFIKLSVTRLPLRILPKKTLNRFYQIFLRGKN